MKLADVVTQLRLLLPKYTDKLSDTLSVSTISAAGSSAAITTSTPHGLVTGAAVTLSNIYQKTVIDSVSQSGLIFTFGTNVDHDLTEGHQETVTLEDFTDSNWNDTFNLVSVPNRRTFSVQSTNTIPTLNGSNNLNEVRVDGINGQYAVTVVSPTLFTISGSFPTLSLYGGTVSSGVRVVGAVDLERAIEQYTEFPKPEIWAFVVMNDVDASKDRSAMSDGLSTPTTGTTLRMRLIDGFTVYVFVNVSQDIAAQEAVDITRHDLLLPILRSAYGARFDTGLTGAADFKTVFGGHAPVFYNKALYVHSYQFESSMDLTSSDGVEDFDTRAFRDIDYTQVTGGDDTTDLTANIDLDDEPIAP